MEDGGLMVSDQQSELLNSFRAFIQAVEDGAPIPSVDEHDLRALHELSIERAKRYCGKDGVISIEMTARAAARRRTCRRFGCGTRNCDRYTDRACWRTGSTEPSWMMWCLPWLPAFR